MRRFFPALSGLVLCAVALAAGMRISVAQLSDFIKSSVEQKIPDKEVAQYVRTITLTDRLDSETIENLQSLGAGPKTVEALRTLITPSARLAPPPPPTEATPAQQLPPRPPPDSMEQARLIDAVRDYALNYTKQLPNFICLRVIRRYYDPTSSKDWRHLDTITAKLTYFDQKEDYQVIGVSDRPDATSVPLFSLGGTMSAGEFGTDLREIFAPSSQAHFEWDHWGRLNGRLVYVFSYAIDQEHSKYSVQFEHMEPILPAYKGLIYVDKATGMVVRLTLDPQLPPGFPVKSAHTVMDYDYQKIGDNEYLLPQKAVLTSDLDRYMSRNETEFRLYHRYGAEATVTFGDEPPPPLPDKTEDKSKPKQ
ncbi:MAG TPA: hypothetical protein VFA04_21120 [Bryobacteraceae bacterium]|nr:hypothetical protein [Bryobacteraceae bacterium]